MLVSKSLLILSSWLFGLTLAEEPDDFSGFKLFQVKPKNDQDRELLGRMDDFYPEDVVDFWRAHWTSGERSGRLFEHVGDFWKT